VSAVTQEADVIPMGGGGGEPREQHPIGQHLGVCVDVIPLGEKLEEFDGNPGKIVSKIAFVFATGLKNAEGRLFELQKELTLSDGERANLPKFLGAWRGKPVEKGEIARGLKRSDYIGLSATLNIISQRSRKGTEYSKIDTVTPVHPMLLKEVPSIQGYTRAPFWETRKIEYADGVAEHRRKQAMSNVTRAPSSPSLSNDAVVAKMIADEGSAQSNLPPF
jgi:hypothetical protein